MVSGGMFVRKNLLATLFDFWAGLYISWHCGDKLLLKHFEYHFGLPFGVKAIGYQKN